MMSLQSENKILKRLILFFTDILHTDYEYKIWTLLAGITVNIKNSERSEKTSTKHEYE